MPEPHAGSMMVDGADVRFAEHDAVICVLSARRGASCVSPDRVRYGAARGS
jgi:hypothetical protein